MVDGIVISLFVLLWADSFALFCLFHFFKCVCSKVYRRTFRIIQSVGADFKLTTHLHLSLDRGNIIITLIMSPILQIKVIHLI